MKIKDLKEKNNQELENLIKEKKERLGQLKFDLVFKKLKDVNEPKNLRKDIARILTIFKERQNEKTK